MDLDSYMGIGLSGNCSRFYETSAGSVWMHIVVALSFSLISVLRRLLWLGLLHRICSTPIEFFLSASHGLVIKFSTLLLQLIIADIESVPSKTMITHSHLISTATKLAGVIRSLLCIE